jgi:pimeloyl-ACP methyl ester carboxylesterase
LIYLPGLHGDWTLIGRFRSALANRVRFVEVTYPRTLSWSLEDYAAAIEAALEQHGIKSGWVLAESFGSQIVWPILKRNRFTLEGIILAGGFVRHPMLWGVRLAERICGALPLQLITGILFGYARLVRLRHSHSPQTRQGIDEFLARRTKLDQLAAQHRLRLIAASNPCPIVEQASVPIYGLTGLFDPIVPWYWVRRWLKTKCASLREYKVMSRADHNVLSTAANDAADLIVRWMAQ